MWSSAWKSTSGESIKTCVQLAGPSIDRTAYWEWERLSCIYVFIPAKTSFVFSLNIFILFFYYYYPLSNMCVPACERARVGVCLCVSVCLRVSFNVFALRMKKSVWIEYTLYMRTKAILFRAQSLSIVCWIVGIGAATKNHLWKKKRSNTVLWRKPPFFLLSARILPRYQ